ncbi:MAG: hypothetical protein FWD31_01250 [Planctomycetaceae bacterium]|nr:hypothetical protein [Planctomycetaceae bacterium]
MRSFLLFAAMVMIAMFFVGLCGCRTMPWRQKNNPMPQHHSVMTRQEDVMAFNGFRTIDASMIEPSAKSKQKSSLLWDKSQARDIERRLGVVSE